MPKGKPKSAPDQQTNKTEFQRFLDERAPEVDPVVKYIEKYRVNKGHYGAWLRSKFPDVFNSAYKKWWLKHPAMFGVIYAEETTQ